MIKSELTVNFIRQDNQVQSVKVPVGQTIMEAAKYYANPPIEGIEADCGGSCSCCTCQVWVEPEWFEKTGPASEDTMEMELLYLDSFFDKKKSRLSCQIILDETLDGITVKVPK